MKKISQILTAILLVVVSLFSFAACNNNNNAYTPPANLPEENGKVLIAYFSNSGNTERVAKSLQEMTGADIFEIERSAAYGNLNEESKNEIDNNLRPELKNYLSAEEMAQYDTVFVGFPIWYKTMPAPVRTFLEHYDFSGKSVISFCTAASDGISGSNADFRASATKVGGDDVNVIFGKRFRTSETTEMQEWINELKLQKPSEVIPEQPEETPDKPDNSENETPNIPEPDTTETPDNPDVPDNSEDTNILIVYFTWSNNTRNMATYIHEQVGGTIYEIVPVNPYPTTSYTQWGNLARDERDNNARPEIKDLLPAETVATYDTVLIGFPIWWHTAPMIIGTFLESYTWSSDVDIYPFFQGAVNTSTEYYNNSMAFVRKCAEGATVHDGLYAASSNTTAINNYLRTNGFIN